MEETEIAKVCHEANRAYCETLVDYSQPAWHNAEAWQKDSAVAGLRFIVEHPDAGPEAQHEEWMKAKLEDGWSYGPEKNAETKQHPCLVEHSALPEAQRAKDRLFIAVAKALLPTNP